MAQRLLKLKKKTCDEGIGQEKDRDKDNRCHYDLAGRLMRREEERVYLPAGDLTFITAWLTLMSF